MALARDRFWLLAGAFSGFMLVAPIVATGLYAISRGIEQQRPVGLADALATWRPRDGRLVMFGVLLALAGTGWVLTSASLITRFAAAPVNSPADFLRVVVLEPPRLAVRDLAGARQRAGGADVRVQRRRHPAAAGPPGRACATPCSTSVRAALLQSAADGAVGRH